MKINILSCFMHKCFTTTCGKKNMFIALAPFMLVVMIKQ